MIARLLLMTCVAVLTVPFDLIAGLQRDLPPGAAPETTGVTNKVTKQAAVVAPAEDSQPEASQKAAAEEKEESKSGSDAVSKPAVVKPVIVPSTPPVVATEPVAAPEPETHVKQSESLATPLARRPFTAIASVGKSDGSVEVAMITLDYHFDWLKQIGKHGFINPYSEFVLSYWEGDEGHTGVSSLHEAGVSLLLRYRFIRVPDSTFHPYVDLGFGMHYLTETAIEGKELGRNWQAGSNIGVGLLFPHSERCELGVRLRHLSNAGTDESNWGVNQLLARFGIRF
jgi:lipid A 3-O-deacylase